MLIIRQDANTFTYHHFIKIIDSTSHGKDIEWLDFFYGGEITV